MSDKRKRDKLTRARFQVYFTVETDRATYLLLQKALSDRPAWFKHAMREALERFLLAAIGVRTGLTVTSGRLHDTLSDHGRKSRQR